MSIKSNDSYENRNLPDLIIFVGVSVFIFLLPVKFGAPVGVPEISLFPVSVGDWLFAIWSPSIFSVLASLLLLIRCILVRNKVQNNNGVSFYFLLFYILFALFSIFGYRYCTCLDFAITQIGFYFGLLAAFLLFEPYLVDQEQSKNILWIITVATIVVSLYGLSQYLSGFSETRAYLQKISETGDKVVSKDFLIRVKENLVFSTFAISNSFAAHIILTFPVCVYLFLWQNPFQHKLFKKIISALILILILMALYLSGSRGAILSLLVSTIFMFLILVLRGKRLFYLFFAVPIILFILSIPKNSESIWIRFDYLRAGIILLKNHLFFGSGWGEFFQSYTYLKAFLNLETPHDPHNFFINIASQSGIFELACGILIFIYPVIVGIINVYKIEPKKRLSSLSFYLLIGVIAWEIHSMIDLNAQIPGTFAVFIIFSILLVLNNKKTSLNKQTMLITRRVLPILICIVTFFIMVPRVIGEYYSTLEHQLSLPESSLFYNKRYIKNDQNINFYFQEAKKYMSYSPFIYADMAQYYFDKEDYPKAEKYLQEAILRARKRASFYYNLAVVQFDMGQKDEAIKSMTKAYSLYPYKYKKYLDNFEEKDM